MLLKRRRINDVFTKRVKKKKNQTMMQPAEDDDDEIFVYMGGDQQVPDEVRRARIHKSVKIVRARAFYRRRQLIYVEFHDGVEIIEERAFFNCYLLRGPIRLLGVKVIKEWAFKYTGLTDVEFGDKLETIEEEAFNRCSLLKSLRIPSVRNIGKLAFASCRELSDAELGEGRLITLQEKPFNYCRTLRRIALPLKSGLIEDGFHNCPKLTTVDLVGGVHNTVASLHMESWRNEINDEINQINQVLPNTDYWRKTVAIRQWMESTVRLLDHCKAEHHRILKEATTLLELALWKANLNDNEGGQLDREGVRTTRGRRKRARKEICVTSGASIVIKNVLPFLQLLK